MSTETKLSTLWIIVLFNLLFADILSLYIALIDRNVLHIIGEVKNTMIIAAIVVNIPICMIYFSRCLPISRNRKVNILASCLTIVFVVGGGSLDGHYIVCATIEVLALLYIIKITWRWKKIY